MAANIEIEAKALITKEEYDKIVHYYEDEVSKEYDQINYYIDTEDLFLKSLGIGLRIRYLENSYKLTLKAPMAEGLLEKDQSITRESYRKLSRAHEFPDGTIKEFVKMFGVKIEDLRILAKLSTHRIEIEDDDLTKKVAIDKNEYNGIVDYELEVEGNALDKARAQLQAICEEVGIVYVDNLKSKQTRALETIKK